MNHDIMKAKWKQLRGKSKVLHGNLTDNRRRQLSGRLDILVGGFQQRYSITRQRASQRLNRRKSNLNSVIKKYRQGKNTR